MKKKEEEFVNQEHFDQVYNPILHRYVLVMKESVKAEKEAENAERNEEIKAIANEIDGLVDEMHDCINEISSINKHLKEFQSVIEYERMVSSTRQLAIAFEKFSGRVLE